MRIEVATRPGFRACGARTFARTPGSTVTMFGMKRHSFLAMLSFVAVGVVTLAIYAQQSPEDADQSEIDKCWEESHDATLTAEKRQIVIGACQALEKAFQLNYGTKLSPGSKDV